MYILFHFPLCPLSRLAKLVLLEKKLTFKQIEEHPWERNLSLLKINPAAEVPVLIAHDQPISSITAICEYLEAIGDEIKFLSNDDLVNAEIRRVMDWFCRKFNNEVTKYLLEEKVILNYIGDHSPRVNFIRAARANLKYHLEYIEFLLQRNKWLASDYLSLADLSAAAQISTLDYLNEIDWEKYAFVKEWYSIVKSRPSFRAILIDRVKGFTPPAHYQNLDF